MRTAPMRWRTPRSPRSIWSIFEKLKTDPVTTGKGNPYKKWTITRTPAPAKTFPDGMAPVFSPRANLDALKWYGTLAGSAQEALFMTFAFGMNAVFKTVYSKKDEVLRVGLMEKEWNGQNKDAQIAAIRKIQALPNVVIAIGNRIPLNGFDRWLGEIDRITDHYQRPLDSPQVHAGRSAFRGSHRRDGLRQFQRCQHLDQRREHARDQGEQTRRGHLSWRIHAPVFALCVPRGGENLPRQESRTPSQRT